MVWLNWKKTFRVSTVPVGFLRYGSKWIDSQLIINLLMAEQDLREIVQREEALEQKLKALEKTASIEADFDPTGLEEIKTQLQKLQAELIMNEYYLYRAESRITPPFDVMYKSLRLEPRWFMRPEMVQDCSHRGGCCSRGCGCCQKRLLSKREKGRGHCTTECLCCANFRGVDLTDKQKRFIRDDLERRLESSYWTVKSAEWSLRAVMANWYLCPLEKRGLTEHVKRYSWHMYLRGPRDQCTCGD